MHRTLTTLALLILCPTLSLAQGSSYDPADWTDPFVVRFRHLDSSLSARLDDGRVALTLSSPPVSVSTTLVGDRLRELRLAFEDAEFADDEDAGPMLAIDYGDGDEVRLDPQSEDAQRLLVFLRDLGQSLNAPPEPSLQVALAPSADAGQGYASVGFDRTQGTIVTAYTLEGQRHVLGEHMLNLEQRQAFLDELARLEADDDAAPTLTPPADGRGWDLRFFTPSRTYTLHGDGLAGLPGASVDVATLLHHRFDQHPVRERTCVGTVDGDRVVCEGVTLQARRPLADLLEKLDGERVAVQAAVGDGDSEGAALYLLARTDDDELVPLAGPGRYLRLLRAMPTGVYPRNLSTPSAQDGDRDWSIDSLELTWSYADAERLLQSNDATAPLVTPPAPPTQGPLQGMVGALGGD